MSTTQKKSIVRELVPLLEVQDIERSVRFYRDHLGFEVAGSWTPDGKLSWCRIQREGSALMLQQPSESEAAKSGNGRGIEFYFVCDDAEVLYSEFTERGLHLDPPETAFYGMKQLFVKDPDGYELCFESPIANQL